MSEKKNLPISQTVEEQVVETVTKKKGKPRNPQKNFGYENVQPGDNAKFLSHALTIRNLPKIDINSNEEVRDRINLYFNLCIENDIKPTVQGLANSLGVSRATLWNWNNGIYRKDDPVHLDLIRSAYSMLEQLWEDYMLNGKINPVSGIFLGKNNFGYTDKQEVVVTPHSPFDDVENAETVSQRYIESVAEDIEE